MSRNDASEATDREPLPIKPNAVRRAFYEGLAHDCLGMGWLRLNSYFLQKVTVRRIRGKERVQKPRLCHLAVKVGRSVSELSRWFRQVEQAPWPVIFLIMTALDADWAHLDHLPEKLHRRAAGCLSALRLIRRRLRLPQPRIEKLELPTQIFLCLDALFGDDHWIAFRQFPDKRKETLGRIAAEKKIRREELDAADKEWGDCYMQWLKIYGDSLDEQIWQ
jgi:hypothetical protein